MHLQYIVKDNKYFNVKEILKSYFRISNKLLIKLKSNNRIFLNNEPTFVNKTISTGDIIDINLDFEEESDNIVPTKMDLDIIYEDEALLIINKNPGIPVHPSILHFENSLSNGVKYYFKSINLNRKIRPVNRLDKDTSGIVVFAKNEYIQEALIRQMRTKQFKKEYYAILEGFLEEKTGTINAPISRKNGSIIEREININGDIAISHYEVQKEFEFKNFSSNDIANSMKLSLVKFILETGRTHQIRLHSKYIKHPILGDTLYSNPSNLINRQALHAYKITFIHPITNNQIILETSLPDDFINIIPKD